MRFFQRMIAGASLLLVAACAGAGGGPLTADGDIATAKQLRAATPFNDALREEYINLAWGGSTSYDYIDAGIFARKAVMAGNNETVPPANLDEYDVPEAVLPEVRQARSELVSTLDGNARSRSPKVAARAQAMFDCWVEKTESVYWIVEDDCRTEFLQAMNQLRGRPMAAPSPAPVAEPPARDYLVFFDFDRATLRADAQAILQRVVGAIRELDSQTVNLIGHADRAGPAGYNQNLSERRAASVSSFLRQQGVPAASITTVGRGESDPRVPTPDGVREQENRRVEIQLQ